MATILGELIAVGRTAEVYALGEDRVVKLFYDWRSSDWVQHEIDIVNLISALPLPTPKILASVEIDGRQGIIYERIFGPSMVRLSMSKPWLIFQLARQFAELHTEIHHNKVKALPSQRDSLIRVIQQLEGLSPDLQASVLELLAELPDGNPLCHLDFHPDQVLITASGPVVIDWLTAQQGHPHSDVARTCVILNFGQVSYGNWIMRTFINLWRGIFYRAYIQRYLELHPDLSEKKIVNWMIPVAAGRLAEAVPGEREPILRFIQSHFLRP